MPACSNSSDKHLAELSNPSLSGRAEVLQSGKLNFVLGLFYDVPAGDCFSIPFAHSSLNGQSLHMRDAYTAAGGGCATPYWSAQIEVPPGPSLDFVLHDDTLEMRMHLEGVLSPHVFQVRAPGDSTLYPNANYHFDQQPPEPLEEGGIEFQFDDSRPPFSDFQSGVATGLVAATLYEGGPTGTGTLLIGGQGKANVTECSQLVACDIETSYSTSIHGELRPVATCKADSQCPAILPRCDLDAGVCRGCLTDEDCGGVNSCSKSPNAWSCSETL